jgi:hypothetical protein
MMEVCWSEQIGDEHTTDSFEHQVSIHLSYTKLYFTDHTENVHKPLQICFICFHNHQKTKNWGMLLVFDGLFRTKKKMFGYH